MNESKCQWKYLSKWQFNFGFSSIGSVPDGPDYVAFYGAYLFQLITMLGNLMCVCAPASIYVGMFFYINGMTEDIKANLKCANEIRPEEVTTQTDTFWQAYVHAMKFHTKIIR